MAHYGFYEFFLCITIVISDDTDDTDGTESHFSKSIEESQEKEPNDTKWFVIRGILKHIKIKRRQN